MLRKEALKILDTVVKEENRGGLTEAWRILRKELEEGNLHPPTRKAQNVEIPRGEEEYYHM